MFSDANNPSIMHQRAARHVPKNNGYKCFWNRQTVEVTASSSYAAQQAAVKLFQSKTRKRVKSYDVTVVLCEKDGKQVTHVPE
jgi:hypothetical protein